MSFKQRKQSDVELQRGGISPSPVLVFPFSSPGVPSENLSEHLAKQAFLAQQKDLATVESRARTKISEQDSPLVEIAAYLLGLGGKRIRPLLALLSGRLFGLKEASSGLIDMAAGVELVHMATLLHDDIIDASPLRRNKPSAYSQFGLSATLLAGDFLFARAFGLCASLDSFIIRETEKTCVELTDGELIEGKLDLKRNLSFQDYETIVEKKTAALFSLAALSGAYLAGAKPADVEKMRLYGRSMGIAFQMVDDLLDVTADEKLLGKPPGTDLKQRTPSLVNVLWLATGDKQAKEFFSNANPSSEQCNAALQTLKSHRILEECRRHARTYAEEAKRHLLSLEKENLDAPTKNHLFALVDYTLERAM